MVQIQLSSIDAEKFKINGSVVIVNSTMARMLP